MRRVLMLSLAALLAGAASLPAVSARARAQGGEQINEAEPRARMTPEQALLYNQWQQARADYDVVHDRYWARIAALKAERRQKRGAGIAFTPADFVQRHAPKYTGPALRADIAKMIADMKPPRPETQLPVLADMLAGARQHYGFTPRSTSEREFKRGYAIEALAFGLTKDQVVRVYALETSGKGTFDMQAGIDPLTGKGRAISTAMGYAQLLSANSTDELTRSGEGFIARLNMMAAQPGTSPDRRAELVAKVHSVRAMLKVARGMPRDWAEHERMGRSPTSLGIHALNLDADIGPWLQAVKLKGLKDLADRNGRTQLSGAQIELMNLAGPRTALDMMEPAAAAASSANFFSSGGYWRNTIVRDKSAAELLVALDARMTENMKNPGAIEFAAVFDEVTGSGTPIRPANFLMAPPGTARQVGVGQPMPSRAPPPMAMPATVPTFAPAVVTEERKPRLPWAPRDASTWSPIAPE